MKILIAMTSAALLAAMAAPALAQSTTDAPTAVVKYGDLNLSSADGRAALRTRVDHAVASVCPRPQPMELGLQHQYNACLQQARDSIRQQLARAYSDQQLAQAAIPAD